jgi:hypothetical protein
LDAFAKALLDGFHSEMTHALANNLEWRRRKELSSGHYRTALLFSKNIFG